MPCTKTTGIFVASYGSRKYTPAHEFCTKSNGRQRPLSAFSCVKRASLSEMTSPVTVSWPSVRSAWLSRLRFCSGAMSSFCANGLLTFSGMATACAAIFAPRGQAVRCPHPGVPAGPPGLGDEVAAAVVERGDRVVSGIGGEHPAAGALEHEMVRDLPAAVIALPCEHHDDGTRLFASGSHVPADVAGLGKPPLLLACVEKHA